MLSITALEAERCDIVRQLGCILNIQNSREDAGLIGATLFQFSKNAAQTCKAPHTKGSLSESEACDTSARHVAC